MRKTAPPTAICQSYFTCSIPVEGGFRPPEFRRSLRNLLRPTHADGQPADEHREPEEPERQTHRQHDHGDAQPNADNHEYEAGDDEERVLDKPDDETENAAVCSDVGHDLLLSPAESQSACPGFAGSRSRS